MHVLLIYVNSLKINFERVHSSAKLSVVSGCGEIMACRGWSWMVAQILWLAMVGDGKSMAGRVWFLMVARFSNT